MKLTRTQIQTDHVPAGYSWKAHLLALFGTAFAVAGICIWRLAAPGAADWAVFGGTILIANLGEYWLHRGPFHVPLGGPFRVVYKQHTIMHHAMYAHDTMASDGFRDLKWILLPAWGFAAVVVVMSPTAYALSLVSPNFGWMLMLALCAYYVVYEILHTLSHLPKDLPGAQSAFVLAITRPHRVHHNPKLMKRYNFNFALPLFDYVFGTVCPRTLSEEPPSAEPGDEAPQLAQVAGPPDLK